MPRPTRISYPGACYHIIMRGNNRSDVFIDEQDRKTFISILNKYCSDLKVKTYGYSLMTNHIHLLLKTELANISLVMRKINWRYAFYFNRKYGRTGHLFQSRFTGKLIDDDKYFLSVLRYIHLNSVKAGMVPKGFLYKWSSSRDYLKGESKVLRGMEDVYAFFDDNKNLAIEKYKNYMAEKISNKEWEILSMIKNVKISKQFRALPEKKLSRKKIFV